MNRTIKTKSYQSRKRISSVILPRLLQTFVYYLKLFLLMNISYKYQSNSMEYTHYEYYLFVHQLNRWNVLLQDLNPLNNKIEEEEQQQLVLTNLKKNYFLLYFELNDLC